MLPRSFIPLFLSVPYLYPCVSHKFGWLRLFFVVLCVRVARIQLVI